MGRKQRAQSPPRSAAAPAPADGEAGSSAQQVPGEPVKEPTPPVTVVYCAGEFIICRRSCYISLARPRLCCRKLGCKEKRSDAFLVFLVCSFPLEYCEFGSSLTRCKEWLKEENPDLYDKYYSEGVYFTKCSLYRTKQEILYQALLSIC